MEKIESKSIKYLIEELIRLTPDPYDIISARFVPDGWGLKVEITFTNGGTEIPLEFDVFGNDRQDMKHIAVIAVRKLLLDFPLK